MLDHIGNLIQVNDEILYEKLHVLNYEFKKAIVEKFVKSLNECVLELMFGFMNTED